MLAELGGALAFVAIGTVVLFVGAELLVVGAERIGRGLGLRAALVGVTLIAFVTTAPELFVAAIGALTVDPDAGLGTVLGSNIANIGLVLGVAAIIKPLEISDRAFRRDVPVVVVAALLCYGLAAWNGQLGRFDGVVMLVVLAGFTALIYRAAAEQHRPNTGRDGDSRDRPSTAGDARFPGSTSSITPRDVGFVVGGLVLLVIGSRWLVAGGTDLLSAMGVSPLVIGLTVLALGTSLPELAASVIGAVRGQTAFAIGNVLGSNVYNLLAVLGIVAIVVPIPVATSTLWFEFPAMVAFTVLLVGMLAHGRRLSRLDGVVLLVAYVIFVYLLFP